MSGVEPDSSGWDTRRLRLATAAAEVGLWSWNIDTDQMLLDELSSKLWEVPSNRRHAFKELSSRIHPDDLDRVGAAFESTLTMTGLYEIDFRIMLSNASIRWISARGHGGEEGVADRVKFGIFLDVTERRQADELREMHAGEMSHRIKNLFAIASGLTAIASRTTTTTTEMARDLTQRLCALGQAHDLVRPTARESDGESAQLGNLLTALLAPYDEAEAIGNRVHVAAPDTRVGMTSATTLALVVHELATNSVKYGALSAVEGRLNITCTSDDRDLVIVWIERGGPVVTAPKDQGGFGSRLISRSVSGQLGGSIAFDWPPGGAVITLRLSKARLET